MAISEARKKANQKYIASRDEIKVRPPEGTKARWTKAAEREGKSLQRYIIDTMDAAAGPDSEE